MIDSFCEFHPTTRTSMNAEHQTFLSELGGLKIDKVEQPPESALPQWIGWTGLFLVCLALLPPAFIYKSVRNHIEQNTISNRSEHG